MREILPQYKLVLVREKEIKYDHQISGVDDAVDLMMHMGLADAPEENVYMFCLDCRGRLIAMHEVSHGTIAAAPLSVRAIFSRALINNASSIILAHNHPSGDGEPSSEDVSVTNKIKTAGDLMEIPLLDHIIIGADSSYSMKRSGNL